MSFDDRTREVLLDFKTPVTGRFRETAESPAGTLLSLSLSTLSLSLSPHRPFETLLDSDRGR